MTRDRNTPSVEPGDWIQIGSIDCVVIESEPIQSRPTGLVDLAVAEVEVVCNPTRPSVYTVHWEGESWAFGHPMRGEYAEYYPTDTSRYVEKLKRGPRRLFLWTGD